MKKLLLLFAIASFAFASCSKDSDEPEKNDPADKIIGKWIVTHFRLSDDLIFYKSIENEYYEFKADKTCIHYSGNTLKKTDLYTYTYDSNSKEIKCTNTNDWSFYIRVEFEDENKAIFDEITILKMVTLAQ